MGDWHAAATATPTTNDNSDNDPTYRFISRRSPVLCRKGCVASSQPLASSIGLDLLRKGANAADTAVAVAAALAVLEPCSTGLGGDMFSLYFDASTKQVMCVNGSGKSPAQLSLDIVQQDCPATTATATTSTSTSIDSNSFQHSVHSITVPGAAKGWEDLWIRHGSGQFSFRELLEPAAQLAEEGFPVSPTTAHHWKAGVEACIKRWVKNDKDGDGNDANDAAVIPLTVDGKHAPEPGQIMYNPDMARVLRELGDKGAQKGFYEGTTGTAIVQAIQHHGGTMTMKDLEDHTSLFPKPIAAEYRGIKLWQVPPNGQGVAALVALTGLKHLEDKGLCPPMSPTNVGTADALHVQMEMMRLGFSDARNFVTDPDHVPVTNEWLLSPERIGKRAQELFNPDKAVIHGQPLPSSCTVSFQVVDQQGNAISFVNSNFMGFGSGLVPDKCGFTLQNRGFGFSIDKDDPNHPNAIAGGKRPCHTIIPAILTHVDTDELYATLSNMGGNMQPQGHLQLTIDLVAGKLDPQAAIDTPRFCIADGQQDGTVFLEDGIRDSVLKELEERGHKMTSRVAGRARSMFGRAQIIQRDRRSGVLWAGSDGRADGCAMGF